jgi:hypothetical protein
VVIAGFVSLSLTTGCKRGETTAPGECGGVCGDGTRCANGMCVVDYLAACSSGMDDIGSLETDGEGGMRPPITDWGQCKEELASLPEYEPIDDSGVPQFDLDAPRKLDMNATHGDEQLAEDAVNRNMREIEYALNECFSRSACYNEGTFPGGTMAFSFRLMSSGQVESVKVDAPEEMDIFSTIQCARKAIFDHRFPEYDGPAMTISYSVELL